MIRPVITGMLLAVVAGCGGSGDPPQPPAATPTPAITPTPTPTPVPLVVTGQVAIGDSDGPARVVSIELHDADMRQRVLPLVAAMLQISTAIREDQEVLRSLRNQVGLASTLGDEKKLLQAEIDEIAELAKPHVERLAIAERALAYYENVQREFIRLGPNRMPVRDPITGADFILNAHDGQRENSLYYLETQQTRHRETAATAGRFAEDLRAKSEARQARIASIDAEIHDLNIPERQARFLEIFLQLRQRARQLAEARELVIRARDNSRAVAVGLSDEKGVFRLEAPHLAGILLVTHTCELPDRRARNAMHSLLWLMPIDGLNAPIVSTLITPSNAALSIPTDTLSAWTNRQTETDAAITPAITDYIAKYPDADGADADWIDQMLE